jgi:hypothetical protein
LKKGTVTMKKLGMFLLKYCIAPALIAWAAFRVSPYHPLLAVLEFFGALYPLAYVETLVHEVGHVLAGLAYGATCSEIRIGGGPSMSLWNGARIKVKAGLYPGLGHVVFPMLPLSRRARIVMYGAGVGAVAVSLLLGWFLIPASMVWLRLEMALVFSTAILGNLFLHAPEEKGVWSDGDAIRGLIRYSV